MRRKSVLWLVVVTAVVVGVVLCGPIMSRVEQAKYTVVKTDGNIEIRDYANSLVAETRVVGKRDEAIQEGFKLIADYIFGNNITQQKIAMTAPVSQGKSEKIAMTAPVKQQGGDKGDDAWTVRFTMPAEYTLATLPKPKNSAVGIKIIPEQRFAVIRFSGLTNEEKLQAETDILKTYLSAKSLEAISLPSYAFYNPPWTLPFLRRNEVMIEIKK